MKIKTFRELKISISADDLAQLLYRAKQGEALFADKAANEKKLCNLKKEHAALMVKYTQLRKEVIKMPSKWTKPKKAEQPKADKPKADKPPKGKKGAK